MQDILLVHRKSNRNFPDVLEGSTSSASVSATVWKTCLRQILFCTEEDFKLNEKHFDADDEILRGEQALATLIEILCGLHSPIIGETEVFGQFKSFAEDRKQLNDVLFSDQQKWLNFLMAEVKKTRADYLVGMGSQSYGSLLRKQTKNSSSVTILGSGQLAQEIMPWFAHKEQLQIVCRDPMKILSVTEKYNNTVATAYSDTHIHGEALVIAAPLSDERIMELLHRQDTRPRAIYDLRGEENNLQALVAAQFPHVTYMGLHQFFAEIEEQKKDSQVKIQMVKDKILEKAEGFMQRTELRPLGWDDLCA